LGKKKNQTTKKKKKSKEKKPNPILFGWGRYGGHLPEEMGGGRVRDGPMGPQWLGL